MFGGVILPNGSDTTLFGGGGEAAREIGALFARYMNDDVESPELGREEERLMGAEDEVYPNGSPSWLFGRLLGRLPPRGGPLGVWNE